MQKASIFFIFLFGYFNFASAENSFNEIIEKPRSPKQCQQLIKALSSETLKFEEDVDDDSSLAPVTELIASKSLRTLWTLKKSGQIKKYSISIGANPVGPKTTKNDQKTPEGLYWIDHKNPNSAFYKALHISYPSKKDIENARLRSVDPGSDIMIHGFPLNPRDRYQALTEHDSTKNWTAGCLAVTDYEIEEIFEQVRVQTPILICP